MVRLGTAVGDERKRKPKVGETGGVDGPLYGDRISPKR